MAVYKRLHNKRNLSFFSLAAALCFSLSACVNSENPATDPTKAKVDPKLYGEWVWHKGERNVGVLWPKFVIGPYKKQPKNKAGVSVGLMICHIWNMNGEKNSSPFFVTPFPKFGIANIGKGQQFTILKYKLSGNRLDIWGGKAESVIKQGLLKGTGRRFQSRLTDTTENIERFIRKGGDSKLFHFKANVYKRVDRK